MGEAVRLRMNGKQYVLEEKAFAEMPNMMQRVMNDRDDLLDAMDRIIAAADATGEPVYDRMKAMREIARSIRSALSPSPKKSQP